MQILINLFALILMFFRGKYIKEGFFHEIIQYLHVYFIPLIKFISDGNNLINVIGSYLIDVLNLTV